MTSDANEPHDAPRTPVDPAASEAERRLKRLSPASLDLNREKFYFEAGRRSALAEIAQASPPAPSSPASPAAGGVWNRRFLGAASHAAAALAAGALVWLGAAGSDAARPGGGVPGNLRDHGPAVAATSLAKDQGKGLAVQTPSTAGGSSAPRPPSTEPAQPWERLTPAVVYSAAAEPSLVRWLDRLDSERAAEPSALPREVEPAPAGRFRNDARTLRALLDARDA